MSAVGSELPKEGFAVSFSGDPSAEGKFFRVKRKEGFEYETGRTTGTAEFSTVASGSLTGFRDVKVLEPDERPQRAAYVEMGFKDGAEYTVKIKSGTIRYGPDGDKNAARLNNQKSPYFDPDPTFAFWLLGPDWFPSLEARNVTPFTITPIVFFKGFKFDLDEITDTGEIDRIKASGKFTIITLGGVGTL